MANSDESVNADDPHNLNRFVQAQTVDYDQALSEIRGGRKRSHWIWYIFPSSTGWGSAPPQSGTQSRVSRKPRRIWATPYWGPGFSKCARGGPRSRRAIRTRDFRVPTT